MKLPNCSCHGTPTGAAMRDANNIEVRVTSPARGCYHRFDDIVIMSRVSEAKPSDVLRAFLARMLAIDIENAGLIAI